MTESDGAQLDREAVSHHVARSTKPESLDAEPSAGSEPRRYRRNSERIYHLIDTSTESLVSSPPHTDGHNGPANTAKQRPNPLQTNREKNGGHTNEQEPESPILPTALHDGNHDSSSDDERKEPDHVSFSRSEQKRFSYHHQRQSADTVSSMPSTTVSSQLPAKGENQGLEQVASPNGHTPQAAKLDPNKPQTAESFYWHSANSHGSSSSLSEVESQLPSVSATSTRNAANHNGKINSSTNSQPTHSVLGEMLQSSASALGFGGPSDWEHFRDYETEEVDDTELYSRSKTTGAASTGVGPVELPVDTSPVDNEQRTPGQANPAVSKLQFQRPDQLEQAVPEPHPPKASLSSIKSPSPTHTRNSLEVSASFQGENVDAEERQSRTQVRSSDSSRLQDLDRASRTSSLYFQGIDVDETIRAWSRDPSNRRFSQEPACTSVDSSSEGSFDDLSTNASHRSQHEAIPAYAIRSRQVGFLVPKKIEVTPHHRQPVENPTAINLDGNQGAPDVTSTLQNYDENTQPVGDKDESDDDVATHEPGENDVKTPLVRDETKPADNTTTLPVSRAIEVEQPAVGDDVKAGNNISLTIADDLEPIQSPTIDETESIDSAVLPVSQENEVEQPVIEEKRNSDSHVSLHESHDIQVDVPSAKDEVKSVDGTTPAVPQEKEVEEPVENKSGDEDSAEPKPIYKDVDQETQSGEYPTTGNDAEVATEKDSECPSSSMISEQHRERVDPSSEPPLVELINSEHAEADGLAQKPLPENMEKIDILQPDSSTPVRYNGVDELYADLDPWGRASLNRYVAMLHEEAQAQTDKEKLNIFTVFASRESKLRAVLYGPQKKVTMVPSAPAADIPKHVAKTLARRAQKALPALPPDEEPQSSRVIEDSGETRVISPVVQDNPRSEPMNLNVQSQSDRSSGARLSLKVDLPTNETQYSPGGRPLVLKDQDTQSKSKNSATDPVSPRDKVNNVLTQFANYMYPVQSSNTNPAEIVFSKDTKVPQKPAYVPFKFNESQTEPIDYLSKRQSAYRPYAALTMCSLENGLSMNAEPTVQEKGLIEMTVAAKPSQDVEANQSMQKEKTFSNVVNFEERIQSNASLDLRRFVKSDFDPLVLVLPSSSTVRQEAAELQDLRILMDAVPDDFSFINQSVVDWDTGSKKKRESFERARHLRQGESERKIDELFDDNEIGYGDISELESEFKRFEAARKTDEDRYEYQTFLSSVFDVVWTRLHYEIDQLTPIYNEYTILINDTLVGKDMFDESSKQYTLAPTMSSLLTLHQKLEVRHQKAFEAVLERDRRLKKTEISPWYTLGNVNKVKQLEKQFESAEKNAITEYCRQRDVRANKLMDVLDHNTLRGVGANQDYMESLMKAVRRVASGRAYASIPSTESGLGIEEVTKAKSITAAIATSSEQIVQTFHVADMLLNAADYEFSVAKAKLVNADADTFTRLKDERAKEDQKLMRDLEHRRSLIREDTRRTHDEITKLMLFLGIQDESLQPVPLPAEVPKHEERIQIALEEAKRRNAAKTVEA